ncbi:MAG: hypothetical protein ACI3VN_04340 [Candidatus Onthomonas sp.]
MNPGQIFVIFLAVLIPSGLAASVLEGSPLLMAILIALLFTVLFVLVVGQNEQTRRLEQQNERIKALEQRLDRLLSEKQDSSAE